MGLARATFNNPISPGIFTLAIFSSSPSSRHASGCVVIWSRKKIAKTRILFSFFFPNFIAKKQLRSVSKKKRIKILSFLRITDISIVTLSISTNQNRGNRIEEQPCIVSFDIPPESFLFPPWRGGRA